MRQGILFYFYALISLFTACKSNTGDQESTQADHLFTLMKPEESGIDFQNVLSEALNTNILVYEYFYNGGGVACGDFNNDGLIDVYFTANMSDNKLYLNKGNMRFMDITAISHTRGRPGPWKTGVNTVDINADGKLDIYVCYSGALPAEKRANELYINQGNNAQGIPLFEERAAEHGLANTGFSNQSYFFDYDKDGDLDMLLLNHNPKNLPILNELSTAELMRKDDSDKGLRLFQQTNGKFEDVTIKTGINGSELSYGLGLGISDFNGDNWPDFYVSNDYAVPDYLYINNKNGTFTNKLTSSIGHTSQFSMGNDVADINNDGLADIFTLDMLPEDNRRQKLLLTPDNYSKFDLNVRNGFYFQYMRNMLQLNNGNGTFSEIAQANGIANTDWSWSPLLADYDNDGWKDLFVTNGYLRDYTNLDFINYMNEYVKQKGRLQRNDVMEIIKQMPSSNVNNYIFQNRQGSGFQNSANKWGITQTSNSNGAAYADLDNDGDLDLVINNINQPAFLYRNDAKQKNKNNFLQVKLIGRGGNIQGLGARVRLFNKGTIQMVEQNPTRGYLSNVPAIIHFGLGSVQIIDSLSIVWNSSKMQTLYNVQANKVLQLNEKEADKIFSPIEVNKEWFYEAPGLVSFQNMDTSMNDFNRQPLLISELSYGSPCMAKHDLNKDGLEDIVVGGTIGQPMRVYLQRKNGSFVKKTVSLFEEDVKHDDAAIAILDANGDGNIDLYIASGGYHKYSVNDPLLEDRLYLGDSKGDFVRSSGLPSMRVSKSCVSVSDINSDGAPDIFVGSRVVPGRYPEVPPSFILINDGKGNFSDQTLSVAPAINSIGLVTSAAWADLNGDKKDELIIAGEWMPITVFSNENGKLVNSTDRFFEKAYRGWWNTFTVSDLNEDGKLDIVAGNVGLNTQFKATDSEPLELYFKDFDNNGSVDPLFSFYIQGKRYPYITRDELVIQLPFLRKRFSTFKDYADVTMEDLFQNGELKAAQHFFANYMATACFINKGGRFSLLQLPKEVQYSPVYSISLIDYNKDGKRDLLLFGNNSHFKIRLGKFDANYGILLAGDGTGNFKYIDQVESGFNVWGDVRSSVVLGEKVYLGINGKGVVTYNLSR